MEESITRLFIASSELFSNFQVNIVNDISTIEDIIVLFKEELNSVLKKII